MSPSKTFKYHYDIYSIGDDVIHASLQELKEMTPQQSYSNRADQRMQKVLRLSTMEKSAANKAIRALRRG